MIFYFFQFFKHRNKNATQMYCLYTTTTSTPHPSAMLSSRRLSFFLRTFRHHHFALHVLVQQKRNLMDDAGAVRPGPGRHRPGHRILPTTLPGGEDAERAFVFRKNLDRIETILHGVASANGPLTNVHDPRSHFRARGVQHRISFFFRESEPESSSKESE